MTRIRGLIAVLLALASGALLTGQTPAIPPLKIHFVDVGQGDGVLIQTPSGQTVVYDAGEDRNRMREYLESVGVTKVDLAVASHNHSDHIGGLPAVLRAFPPPFVMENAVPTTTDAYAHLLEAVQGGGSQVLDPTARKIFLGDVSLQIIPPPGVAEWDQNDNSIGMILQYGSFRLSLMGDAEPREWAWWLANMRDLMVPTQVHKSSHHGSVNGDTDAGLSRLAPTAVVIGVGAGNSYGHPDQQALDLYAAKKAQVFRTDRNGTVIVEVTAAGIYSIKVEQGQGAQPPPPPIAPPSTTPLWSLSGTVTNVADNSRLGNATVQVLDGPNLTATAFTNATGDYSFAGLLQSGFTLRFSKPGFNFTDRSVTVTKNTTLNAALSRSCTAPSAPTLFASVSGTTATLTWSSIATATGYAIGAGTSSGSSAALSTTTGSTSYAWSGVTAGTYYARVRATNACGPSGDSNQVTFTVSAPPTTRTRVGATCNDGTSSTATGSGACSSHGGVRCWRYSDGSCTLP